jgi:peroxiredoxin
MLVAACLWIFLCATPHLPVAMAAEEKTETGGNPNPEQLLRAMADYLAKLQAVSCKVDLAMNIQAPGMDNRMESKMTVRLERPNRVALVVEEGVMGMTVVSDGKQVIQFLPALKRYAVTDAPAELAALAESNAGMGMMGMTGLLIPNNGEEFYKSLVAGATKSEYLGTEKIGDVNCHHCRFIQESVDWDIWIEVGKRPVVHKATLDMSKQFAGAGPEMKDAKFEWSIAFTDWNTAPKFADADFAFTPPADAQQVENLFEGLTGGQEEPAPHALLGQPAPVFQTVDLNDQPIDIKPALGKNVILLDFWATWCGPCVEAMPKVQEVAQKFADKGVVFYTVNSGEDALTVREFLNAAKLDVPVAMDVDNSVSTLYHVQFLPQTVLVGKDGKVHVVHEGFSDDLSKQLTADIEALLAGKDLASETLAEYEKSREQRSADQEPDGRQPANATAGEEAGDSEQPEDSAQTELQESTN